MATVEAIVAEPNFEITLTLAEAKALQRLIDSRMYSINGDESKELDSLEVLLDQALYPFRR